MMAPRILVVDDEAPARERLRTLLSDIAVECPHELLGEAADGASALEAVARLAPDLVLLDVHMPGMNGLELAAQLRKAQPGVAVIFISAHDEFALKAFEVHALDYLQKPVRAARLAEAIGRAASLRRPAFVEHASASVQGQRRKNFPVQERGRLLLVPVADVLYLKAELKYLTLRTAGAEYLIEESLQSVEEEFGDVFVRVHRNALVARAAIVGVERSPGLAGETSTNETERTGEAWQVILAGLDERLPVSRRQWGTLKELIKRQA
jgi:two-component system response regulator AlgR